MESRAEVVERRGRISNATILFAVLSLVLIGWIAFRHLDLDAYVGGGVSIVLVNDTMEPMDGMSL